MSHQIKVGAWVRVEDGCPVRYYIAEEDVYFVLGSPREEFELAFTTHSLGRFIELAHHAEQHLVRDQNALVTLADLTPVTG